MPTDVHHRLSVAAFWYSALPAVVFSFIVVIVGAFLKDFVAMTCAASACPPYATLLMPGLVLSLIVAVLSYPVLEFILFSFVLSTNAITINSGIFFRQYETIPFARIQTLDLERGPILWLFGLTEVQIWTANPDQLEHEQNEHARADTKILLPAAEAETLREFILKAKMPAA